MKVCHVTSVHKRYDGRIFQKECSSLAKAGYDVTLLCVDNLPDEIKNGVKIKHIDLNYKNKFDRILNSSKKILSKALEIDADVYHLHDPELILLGKKLNKKGKKIIFDSHEDYPGLIMEKTWIKKPIRNIMAKYYENLEKKNYPKFSALITVSPHIVNRLKKMNKNTYMVTNYPIITNVGNKNKFENYICFAGGITSQWNHEIIIKSLKDIKVEYKIAGKLDNSYKEKLEKLEEYKKVKYLGILSLKDVSELYKEASIGMALCSDSRNVDGHNGSLGNTKLFEYMAAGVPIICSDFKLWKKIIDKYECGICVDINNVEEVHNAILKILNNKELQINMSKNGIKAVQNEFNWETQEKILFKVYKEIKKQWNSSKN